MVCRDEYNVAQDISLGHFTYEKSPLGCAAGQAVIDFIEKEKILEKVARDALCIGHRLGGRFLGLCLEPDGNDRQTPQPG